MSRTSIALLLTLLAAALAPACANGTHSVPASAEVPKAAGGSGEPPGPQPEFGPLVSQSEPPPPISGGTLAVAPDGKTAVAADTDRDRVYIVDLPSRAVSSVSLPAHAEPGRVAIDDFGKAWVILRRAGGVAVIDLATGTPTLRPACDTPRGIAYDKSAQVVRVTCADGTLVTIPASGDSTAVTTTNLGLDLRDVVVHSSGTLTVSRFRSAKLLEVSSGTETPVGDALVWRAVAVKPQDPQTETTATVAQEASSQPVNPAPGGYGGTASAAASGECAPNGIVATRLTLVGKGSVRLPEAVLPVDLATNGHEFVVVAAGNAFTPDLPQLFIVYAEALAGGARGCVPAVHGNVPGQAVAAAFDGSDELLVQTREPAALHIMTPDRRRPLKTIDLASDSRLDTGHAIFHSNAGGFLACASCHAEGADDAHVWEFVGMGPRRTPSLLGTVEGTQPYHWDGRMKDLRDLVDHVFVERMSGPHVDDAQLAALQGFLFALPPPKPLRAASAQTDRGRQLFEGRCTSCHSGPRLTNNQTVDVGTGGAFQVPSLIGVGWRAPLLHRGCGRALEDRFDPSCGGTKHAVTEDLAPDQIADLVAFLETL
jgi:cytochrome c peroxidase